MKNEELVFRGIFWLSLFFLFLFNRLLPVLRARKSGGKFLPGKTAIKNEGKFTFLSRVILFFVFIAILVLYTINPPFMAGLNLDFPLWSRWLGTGIAFAGQIFGTYAQFVLGRNWSPQLQIQEKHHLVTSGPYRFVRHPIYVALIIWQTGLCLLSANLVFFGFLLVSLAGTAFRVPREEKMMIDEFGDEYLKYMQNTARFFPRFMTPG